MYWYAGAINRAHSRHCDIGWSVLSLHVGRRREAVQISLLLALQKLWYWNRRKTFYRLYRPYRLKKKSQVDVASFLCNDHAGAGDASI
jgi:hypothetical protein